jgi:hypothetical protein
MKNEYSKEKELSLIKTLKPCPFCGHTPKVTKKISESLTVSITDIEYEITCIWIVCPVFPLVNDDNLELAIKRWNHRKTKPLELHPQPYGHGAYEWIKYND